MRVVALVLDDVCESENLTAFSLRYFNPIGCDPLLRSGPHHAAFRPVLPAMLDACEQGRPFCIHGADWPTRDGTPVRDFVDVWDLARVHVAAARSWPTSQPHEVVNVGSGQATTISELATIVGEEMPNPLHVEYDGRRGGDATGCAAVIEKAHRLFGWRPQRSVRDSIHAAIRWRTSRHQC
jgi:UDP-glucose 4-epimerase